MNVYACIGLVASISIFSCGKVEVYPDETYAKNYVHQIMLMIEDSATSSLYSNKERIDAINNSIEKAYNHNIIIKLYKNDANESLIAIVAKKNNVVLLMNYFDCNAGEYIEGNLESYEEIDEVSIIFPFQDNNHNRGTDK